MQYVSLQITNMNEKSEGNTILMVSCVIGGVIFLSLIIIVIYCASRMKLHSSWVWSDLLGTQRDLRRFVNALVVSR